MSKGITMVGLVALAVLSFVYFICPDPFFIAVDDVAAILINAASTGAIISKSLNAAKTASLIEN